MQDPPVFVTQRTLRAIGRTAQAANAFCCDPACFDGVYRAAFLAQTAVVTTVGSP